MATNANWTVIFNDRVVIKQTGDYAGVGHVVGDDAFWNQSKFSNIWAIQYQTSVSTDEVEYRDQTPNGTYADANLGDFQTQFIDKWDAANLPYIQAIWDNDNVDGETPEQKIARLGARPTSYSS